MFLRVLRAGPRVGIPVDPERIRKARAAAGLTMAQLADGHVSRAFISQLENGAARPSAEVLELIATRTGKPVSYFTAPGSDQRLARQQLVVDLTTAAAKLKRVRETRKLDLAQREMLKTLEFSLRRGAVLLRSLDPSTRLTGQG